jgi:hypothetical protein
VIRLGPHLQHDARSGQLSGLTFIAMRSVKGKQAPASARFYAQM